MVRTANGPVLVITELTDLVFIVVRGDAGVFDVVSFGPSQLSSKEEYKPWHLIQRPCYQRGSPCQDPAGNRTA